MNKPMNKPINSSGNRPDANRGHFISAGLLCLAFLAALQMTSPAIAAEPPVIKEDFTPGQGPSVGEVLLMEGRVVIVHANAPDTGYAARIGLPLYKGDILITGADGKISFQTQDKSTITLSVNTRLTINESIFSPSGGGDRAGFMSMAFGKTRFLIRKLTGFGRSEFRVKTKTAIVGVRGSDFIVDALPDKTIVTAFEKTDLELIGISSLCPECVIEPILIADFQQAMVSMDGSFSEVIELFPEEIKMIKQEFNLNAAEDGRRRIRELEFDRRLRLSLDPDRPGEGGPPDSDRGSSLENVRDELAAASPADEFSEEIAEDFSETEREDALQYLPDFPWNPELHKPDETGAEN